MIKSMTGFAALTREDDRVALNVTLRAVNHRFLDVQTRMPPSLGDQEARIRALVQQVIARGRIDVSVGMQSKRVVVPQVELNEAFVAALEHALERARLRGVVAGHLTPGDLVRLPHALTIVEKPAETTETDVAAVAETLAQAVEEAVRALEQMRLHEGEHLRQDLDARRSTLAALIERIASAAADGQAGVQARLRRLLDSSDDQGVNPALQALKERLSTFEDLLAPPRAPARRRPLPARKSRKK